MKTIYLKKADARSICGTLTQTSKMPCKSSSLPTESCITGFRMAQIPGSICSQCYAEKGFYRAYANTIKPSQFARLDSVWLAMSDAKHGALWVSAMASLIGSDEYFRHHDSGDLQGLAHLELIAQLCNATTNCKHWLPTREYGIVKDYIAKHGKLPANLTIRLSAMYPDKPVQIPKSLQGIRGITASNVHTIKPLGNACKAPAQNGACMDCRECWTDSIVSYALH